METYSRRENLKFFGVPETTKGTDMAEGNLVPRAHVSFGQRQDTELWNNPFQESKILGLPVSRRVRALV